MTGWSEANVKVRVFSARQKLRRILERDHGR
jgi:DNA-directed RNA polymerase specialized sigma24 family protein